MKKYLFLAATFLLTMSMTVSAQNNKRDLDNRRGDVDNRRSERMMKMTPKERADLMAKELDLTAEQTAQVEALCEKQDAERLEQVKEQRSKRGTGTQNRDARREEFRKMRDKEMLAQQAELEKIIGKEKAEKWNELRKDVRDANRAGRVNGRGDYRNNQRNINNRRNYDNRNYDNRRSEQTIRMTPQKRADLMTKELNLTTEQSAQVLALCEKQEAERAAQVTEQRNTRGMGTQNRDARREEFRAMREKQMKEQQAELEKIVGKEKAEKWNELRKDVRETNRAGRRNPQNRNR